MHKRKYTPTESITFTLITNLNLFKFYRDYHLSTIFNIRYFLIFIEISIMECCMGAKKRKNKPPAKAYEPYESTIPVVN